MPKSKSVQRREAIQKEVTYRLHVTDSNNHSAFIDIELLDVPVELRKVYNQMIAEHAEAQENSKENDKGVAKRVKTNANKLNVKEQPTIAEDDGTNDLPEDTEI